MDGGGADGRGALSGCGECAARKSLARRERGARWCLWQQQPRRATVVVVYLRDGLGAGNGLNLTLVWTRCDGWRECCRGGRRGVLFVDSRNGSVNQVPRADVLQGKRASIKTKNVLFVSLFVVY